MLTRTIFVCRKCGKVLRSVNFIKSEDLDQRLETLKIKCFGCGNIMDAEVQKFNPPYWRISSFRDDTQTPLWLTFLDGEIVGLWHNHIEIDVNKLLTSGFGGDLEIISGEPCYRLTLDPLTFSFTEGRKKSRLIEPERPSVHRLNSAPSSESPFASPNPEEALHLSSIIRGNVTIPLSPFHPEDFESPSPLNHRRRRTQSGH